MTMPAARRPFASLSGTRLKNLTNVKNQQNALPSTGASSLKRHAPSEFDDVDSENVDPLMFSSPSKKSRALDFKVPKPSKAPIFTLTPAKPPQYVQRAEVAGQKRKVNDSIITPDNNTHSGKRIQPSSAPAPAGRSPKSKKAGILSRRRMTANPFTRINPPTFSTGGSGTDVPFSIDAALAGTVSAHKSKSKSKSSYRKSWQFEIHEDTPEQEMENLMQHSACTLDISDDETRPSIKGDGDNKENIPPVDGSAALSVAASRQNMMTDESRSPLGDLDAEAFYAEGCDASSAFTVPGDEVDDNVEGKCLAPSKIPELPQPARPRANAITDSCDGRKQAMAQLDPLATTIEEQGLIRSDDDINNGSAEIQIWESESAKGENDDDDRVAATEATTYQAL